MATLRELKGRIGSVSSSEKITGAMKMISSAKMRKAEGALRQLRPFRDQVETIMANLLQSDIPFTSPLMEEPPIVERVALVVWGSDDGLCGAYNVNIFKLMLQRLSLYQMVLSSKLRVTLIPVGSKMTKACRKLDLEGVEVKPASDMEVNSKSSDAKINEFAWWLRDHFLAREFDRIDMLYMQFLSVSRQREACQQLLPASLKAFTEEGAAKAKDRPYLYEPSPEAIFAKLLPMHVLAVVTDAFIENRASEQAARVMAMQSANDNAKKLNEQLKLEYNKLRQQAITNELLDILGGQVK